MRPKADAGVQYNRASAKTLTPVEMNQVASLFNSGRYAELENRMRILIEKYPNTGFAWKVLGVCLHLQGKDALQALQKSTELMPDDAAAHNNLGNALKDLGRLDDAVASYRRALEIDPDNAEAHSNLGNSLKECGKLDEAVASYRRALQIKPDYAEACHNMGNILKDICRLDDAVASYRRALQIKPDLVEAQSNLLFTLNYLADQPSAMLLDEARRCGDLVGRKASPYGTWLNAPDPDRSLRVGLVSGDFGYHPVGYFLDSILSALASQASTRLELIAYSNDARTDALTERIKACCRSWHSAVGLSDAQLAQLIRDDGIDILIDLSGHTEHNRLPMFAWKPAPVQASWLGYFATTGVAAMDYLIADPWTLPESEEAHFTEKIQRLPETYLCFTPPDMDIAVSPLPALINGHITFGCFNTLSKMNDTVVALWARVLHAVPQSRLFLKAKHLDSPSVQQSVLERFSSHGITADRLMLEGAAPRAELLEAYRRVDIALDPFPYPGGTTSIEALWMGVPVLTLMGDRFLSHIGESILQNAGLPEWVAADADGYVARAVSHASDLPRLETLRTGLRQQVLASPLFDAPRFARHFEAALREMWTQWCDRQKQA
jgi:protein O-GlcNAc transferase